MSEHTTEETLMYLRQCLLPGNAQDGIDLEIPSWLVREAVTALARLSTMEGAHRLLDDAGIEHSGRTLDERVREVIEERDTARRIAIRIKKAYAAGESDDE